VTAVPEQLRPVATATPGVVIAVTATIAFVISLDPTMVSVANPTIADSLNATLEGTQWITTGFLLAITVLLIPCGALADRIGRARMLAVGLTLFTAGALTASAAGDVGPLVFGRLLMGTGAAAMQPAAVAAFRTAFAPERRARAMGMWAATAVLGSAAAPVLAGAALGVVSWRMLFVTVGLATLVLLVVVVTRLRGMPNDGENLPVHGLRNLALAVGLGLLTWGLIRAGARGWTDAQVLVPALAGVVMLAGVGYALRRGGGQDFDLPPIVLCVVVMSLTSIGYVGTIFLLGILLQRVGFTPLEVGLQLLPFLALAGVISMLAGPVEARLGTWRTVLAATVLELVALLGLAQVRADSGFGDLWPWLAILGVSFGLITPAILNLLMRSAPLRRSGVMGAMQMASTQLGGVLAVAVLGSIVASTVDGRFRANLTDAGLDVAITPAMSASLSQGIVDVPAGLAAGPAALLHSAGLEAFASGMGTAFAAAMAPVGLALLIALLLRGTLSGPRRH
jgi:MFS family permease